MLLQDKVAILYGAGGGIGGAVARAFAREGAVVHVTGRTQPNLDAVVAAIRADGGDAHAAVVDATDKQAVDAHADAVASSHGRLDISFNMVGHGEQQGTPMVEMDVDDYVDPVAKAVRTHFLTAAAAARHMTAHGGGVLLAFGGAGDPPRGYHLGSLQTGFEAVESMRKQLSVELGEHGIRFVTLRSGGVPETIPADFDGGDAIRKSLDESTLTGRSASLEDVGDIAAFVASDKARTMTAATVNTSAGALID